MFWTIVGAILFVIFLPVILPLFLFLVALVARVFGRLTLPIGIVLTFIFPIFGVPLIIFGIGAFFVNTESSLSDKVTPSLEEQKSNE